MRLITVLPILALWGCSDDSSKSGSCPQAAVKVFEKVVKGSTPDPQEVQELDSAMKNASDSDQVACEDLFVANEQAWEFVYGREGPSKMAAFKRLEGDMKKQATAEFVQALAMKIALAINGPSPQFGTNPSQFGNLHPPQFGNNPLPFGNNPPQFGNHQPPQFGNNPPQLRSCPAKLEAIFRKVIVEKVIGEQEIFGMDGAQPDDFRACLKIFLNDEKAWEFVHGNEGPSKMAEFKSFHGDKKGAAEMEFVIAFLGKFQAILRKAVAGGNLRKM